MGSILIENGAVITLTGSVLNPGSVLVEGKRIGGIFGPEDAPSHLKAQKVIDASNKVVMPGLICAHHHLYSTMARGMSIPGRPAANFLEILERLWWRLDYGLNEEDVYLSALVATVECIKKGTTTIVDHHASPSCRDGSLDILRRAVEEAGMRACLCYEVSDRNLTGGGLDENRRFLESLKKRPSELVAGMVGLHASFTLGDETISRCVEVAQEYGVGCHIHVAEDKADRDDSIKQYGVPVVERLCRLGLAGKTSLLVHCIWIDEKEMDLIKETDALVVHNPESNMNNAVGVAKALAMMKKGILVGLGTDGMSSDMLSQMRCAYLLHRQDNRDPRVAFVEAPKMLLENNHEIVRRVMGMDLGTLAKGKLADLIIVDYDPPTPINEHNLSGHLIFGVAGAAVDTTICNGQILMENQQVRTFNVHDIMVRSREQAARLWNRLERHSRNQ